MDTEKQRAFIIRFLYFSILMLLFYVFFQYHPLPFAIHSWFFHRLYVTSHYPYFCKTYKGT